MPGKPLRSQLNQIRAWEREGRTDAWIAHQLDISASELREFRRRHDLEPDAEAAEAEPDEDEDEDRDDDSDEQDSEDSEDRPRRRRRRRGGRGRRRAPAAIEGTFDHGDEGYGLWLDPSVKDNAVYAENWAGHRA